MKKLLSSIFLCSMFMASLAQDKQERKLEPFTKVVTDGIVKVKIGTADSPVVVITGDTANVLTVVENGTLNIYNTEKLKQETEVFVSVKDVNSIKVTGAAELSGASGSHPMLEVLASGAGKANVTAEAKELNVTVSEAGSITLTGTADKMNATVTGAGTLRAKGLSTRAAILDISEAGNATIKSDSITGKVDGAGKLKLAEQPRYQSVRTSGAGTVSHATGSDSRIRLGNYDITVHRNPETPEVPEVPSVPEPVDGDSADAPPLPPAGPGNEKQGKKKKKSPQFHYSGIDLGVNGYLDNGSLSMPASHEYLELSYPKSLMLNANILQTAVPIVNRYLSIGSGMSIGMNTYAFRYNTVLTPASPTVTGIIDTINSYSKSKLKTFWVDIPVMIEANTSRKESKSFHFAAGVSGGYMLGAYTKVKFEEGGSERKNKFKDDFNLNPFRLNAVARVGYGRFTLFSSYGLSELFKGNTGPKLHPFTVGLSVLGFY